MSGWAQFRADLATSSRAWVAQPWLPVLTFAFGLIAHLSRYSGASFALFPITLFEVGFFGTQRIWYLRAFRGDQFDAREVWRLSWAFFLRFATLGFLVGLAFVPFGIVGSALGVRRALVLLTVGGVIADIALTFVTPALAYSTRSVGEAWRIARAMLRDGWPTTAWYSLAPPLAVEGVFRALPRHAIVGPADVLIGGATATLTLWFKGAVASYYLRQEPGIGRDGAAYSAPRT